MAQLVTGGTGFIGRCLVRRLASQVNNQVRVVDIMGDAELSRELPDVEFYKADITQINASQWEYLLKEVSVIYHLSGLLGTSELYSRVLEAERVNVLGTLNLLEAMSKNGARRIIFTSKPNIWKYNVYTITKENCERYLEMYRVIHGLETTILRPFNIYGPEEKVEQYRKAVPYFIIAALKNEPIEIFGDGEQTMDLLYVSDCVDAFIALAKEHKAIGDMVEVGSGVETSVKDLAQLIIRLSGSKSEIKYLPMRKGETPGSRIKANIDKMQEGYRIIPRVTLEEGISATIAYYRKNLDEYKVYEFTKEELV